MDDKIQQLWEEHLKAKYPSGYRGVEIKGIELILLDADTAGCVSTFLICCSKGENLDLWRTAILGKCYRDLTVVVQNLSGEPRVHFERLEHLALVTLDEVIAIENNKKKQSE